MFIGKWPANSKNKTFMRDNFEIHTRNIQPPQAKWSAGRGSTFSLMQKYSSDMSAFSMAKNLTDLASSWHIPPLHSSWKRNPKLLMFMHNWEINVKAYKGTICSGRLANLALIRRKAKIYLQRVQNLGGSHFMHHFTHFSKPAEATAGMLLFSVWDS